MVTDHPFFMDAAIAASTTFAGHTWPNPSVGCVLVKGSDIIATGCTQMGGRPHAEMDALAKAGTNANGATAYVTLEPCNHAHEGKPVSCCDGLIAAGIKRIVVGMQDPDPRMAGKSLQKLRDAGIEVYVLPVVGDVGYLTRLKTGRPRVTLKLAHSRDKKIGLPGEHVAISREESWQKVFALRGHADAVLVGINTVLVDDPLLTDRRNGSFLQPIRIVADRHARLPRMARMVIEHEKAPVWLLTAPDSDAAILEKAGVRIIRTTDMTSAFKTLGDIGLNHILCEGGAALATSLLNAQLVDDVILIEGNDDIGPKGIPLPAVNLPFKSEEKIGADTWRYYARN